MNLTRHSQQRLQATFDYWNVPREYSAPITNYLLHGLPPGNFFAALIANDALAAIQSCHPANTIESLKCVTGWMQESLPAASKGSWNALANWYKTSDAARRIALEDAGLIYTEEQEILLALKETA